MTGPWPRELLDADPLSLELDPRYQQGRVDGIAHSMVVEEARARRRDRLGIVAVLAAAGALVTVGFVAGRATAAPRPAQTTVRVDVSAHSSAGPTGAPSVPERPDTREGNRVEASPEAPVASDSRPAGAPLAGVASWYRDPSQPIDGLYAAVPSWHFGDRRYRVRVTAGDRSVIVTVRDFCGCPGGRVIDLSPEAFARLAPLSRGLVRVTVERIRVSQVTPPPTDAQR